MNKQKAEKINHKQGLLEIHSIFDTIQGEGPYTGKHAVFIRLAGCNLECPGCDTDYTSDRKSMGVVEILERIVEVSTAKFVVITGGEPFRQNITELVNKLLENNYDVQIETNGTIYLDEFPYDKVCVVCSPKTPKIHPKIRTYIKHFKYVIDSDFVTPEHLPIKVLDLDMGSVAEPSEGCVVYVQPYDTKDELRNKNNLNACIDCVMTKGYTLCLQTHKIIGVE